jgi:peptidoglycan/LPS O-acetylase OafA/YrhL
MPTATPTPARSRDTHFPCFDGLRAIAALTVVGVHTAFVGGLTVKRPEFGRYTSRLEIGVEVFFVISGFLLYRPFALSNAQGHAPPDRRRFWIRRLKRIIPAYWIAFIVATYVLRADTTGHGWYAPLVYLGFAQIYFPHYILHGLSQAWSLCTEMTFYLMIPMYAAAVAAYSRRATARDGSGGTGDEAVTRAGAVLRVELIGLAVLTAISFAWRIPILAIGGVHAHGYLVVMPQWLPGYLDQFAFGMLLAVLSAYFHTTGTEPRWLSRRVTPWASWAVAAVAFIAVSNIGLPLPPLVNSPVGLSLARQALYGVFALFIVAPAVFGPQDRGGIRAALRSPPLVLAGVVSYGVYLWHEAWMHMFLTWTGDRLFDIPWPDILVPVTALALAAAGLSYRLAERPIIRGRIGTRPALPRPAPASQPAPLREGAEFPIGVRPA